MQQHKGGCDCQLTSETAVAVLVGWEVEDADVVGTSSRQSFFAGGGGVGGSESDSNSESAGSPELSGKYVSVTTCFIQAKF